MQTGREGAGDNHEILERKQYKKKEGLVDELIQKGVFGEEKIRG